MKPSVDVKTKNKQSIKADLISLLNMTYDTTDKVLDGVTDKIQE